MVANEENNGPPAAAGVPAVIAVTCPECRQPVEFPAVFQGCRRPCPRCEKRILVSTGEPGESIIESRLDRCPCGRVQENEREGYFFELTTVGTQGTENKWAMLVGCLLAVFMLPLAVLFSFASTERYEASSWGWCCDRCVWRLRFLRFWSRTLFPLILLIGSGLVFLYLNYNEHGRLLWRERGWTELVTFVGVLSMFLAGAIGYLLYWLVMSLAAGKFQRWLGLRGTCRKIAITKPLEER